MPFSIGNTLARTVVITANSAWNLANFRLPIIEALVESGYRVVAAAASDGSETRLTAIGAEFRALPVDPSGRNPLADLRLFLSFTGLLLRERPAAILTFTIKPNIYGALAARLTGTPLFATISGLGSAFLAGGPTARLIDRLYRLALGRARAVFFQNDDDRDLFLERGLVTPEQVRRVPGSGVDVELFARAEPPSNARPVFLFVGRLLWDKGIREFADAARLICQAGEDVELRMVGECGVNNPSAVTDSEVARWVADGIVTYQGPTDDVRAVIADSDCVVLPSYREGVPRSLLEAAAMGRPLIASDVPGCRDVVEHGVNGFLVPPRSASALAEAILRMTRLSSAERDAMGRSGRDMVEREFAVERVVAAYRAELQR